MRSGLRGLLWMAAVLLCMGPCAFAQSVNLQISNPPSNNVLDGIYVGPYTATNTQMGASMQITCDDFMDESNYNNYSYNVSTFGNFGSTLWGSGDAKQYDEAAWLDLGMLKQTGLVQGYYSYAIWAIFDPGQVLSYLQNAGDTQAICYVFGSSCAGAPPSPGGLLHLAQASYGNGNYSNFVVLTPQGCTSAGSCQEQEFLAQMPMPVPEGGSGLIYVLLAGIACFAAMFCSRRQNARAGLA